MAVPSTLQFTVLGEGPVAIEVYLGMICPASKKALRSIAEVIVPEILEGGKYHGKARLIFRLAPYIWHPQGCYVAEHVLAFGRVHCTEPKFNSRLWFNCLRELMERQSEFYDHRVQDESPNSIKERLNVICGEVVERAGLGSKEEAAEAVRSLMRLNNFRFGGTPLIGDSKYYSHLVRQNGVWSVPTIMVNGLEDTQASSGWTTEQWSSWLDAQVAPFKFNAVPKLPPASPPREWTRLPLV